MSKITTLISWVFNWAKMMFFLTFSPNWNLSEGLRNGKNAGCRRVVSDAAAAVVIG